MKQNLRAWVDAWLRRQPPLREIREEHRKLKTEVALLAAEIVTLKTQTVTPTELDLMPIDPHLGRM